MTGTTDLDATPSPTAATRSAPNWRKTHALGLPEGSIRAVLALAIFATIWILLARQPGEVVPDYLRDLLFIVMGHYFAARRSPTVMATAPKGPAPLFLPRGSIRLVIFAGFAAVGVLLYRQGHLLDPAHNPGVVTLMLVAGFLLGVTLARIGDWWKSRGHRVSRGVEDVKAVVAMLSAAALILMVWNRYDPLLIPRPAMFAKMPVRYGDYGLEHLFGAIVGFYFGSRS